jgi:hypothetical protein
MFLLKMKYHKDLQRPMFFPARWLQAKSKMVDLRQIALFHLTLFSVDVS